MAGFTILLPPSGVQQAGGNPLAPKMFDRRSSTTFNYFIGLNPERREVIDALQDLDLTPKRLAKALGVDEDKVDYAVERNKEVMNSPLMSALDRYSPGAMYAAMDFENLPTGAQRRLLEQGVILSSLFGLLRPDDLIPEYYLTHDAKLPKLGKKAKDFWQPYITEEVNKLVPGHLVWNLLPDDLDKLWKAEEGAATVVTLDFRVKKRGKLEPATDDLAELYGGFVNMLVRGSADSIDSLEEMVHPKGYSVDFDRTEVDEETKLGTVVLVK